jgi:hypothetical protein
MEQNHKKMNGSKYETKRKTPTRKTNIEMETTERKDGKTSEKVRRRRRRRKTETYCEIRLLRAQNVSATQKKGKEDKTAHVSQSNVRT